MRVTHFVTGAVLMGLMASPAFAQEGRRRRAPEPGEQQQRGEQQRDRRGGQATGERAVPRESVQPAPPPRAPESRGPADNQARAGEQARRNKGNGNGRTDNNGRYDNDGRYDNSDRHGNGNGRYDNRGGRDGRYDNGRAVGRTYYPYYSNRGYGPRTIIMPRYIRPSFVTIVPYRPYYYRPSIGIGIYYGNGGYYPYGYTPRGYYDPIPGRPYGGLRITGFSRDAQVFADGYYVGIVNDFDGMFQAVNLEAGPHRIEIVEYGREAVEFDVMIQPGRTMTFRGEWYRY